MRNDLIMGDLCQSITELRALKEQVSLGLPSVSQPRALPSHAIYLP